MKYIKLFESKIEDRPKVGDYVYCQKFNLDNISLDNFLSNNIGDE